MAVSFSYETYPDLWDRIIAFVDHNTQLRIRLLSRKHRLKIDRKQAHHLVLSTEGPEQTVMTGPHHHHPHFREEAHRFDEPRFWNSPATQDLLKHTRVLDIQGYCPPVYDPDLLLYMRFPALEVLRMTHAPDDNTEHFHPYIPPAFYPAKTLVLFSDQSGMDSLRDHWWFQTQKQGPLDEEHMVPTRFFLGREAVPLTVMKVVINLRGEDPEVSQMWPFTVDLPEHVKELVIVGPRYSTLKHWGSVGELTPEVAVDNLAEVMFNPHAEKVTFVGFERMPAIKAELEASLRETYRTATYDDVDYEIDDEATRHLPKTKRAMLIREAKRRRAERKTAYDAAKASAKDPGESENKHKDQGNGEDGEGCDGAVGKENEEECSIAPLLGYKQKIDRMLASYEFVTKHAYIQRVGEETAALELLEYLDPKDRKFKKGRHWRHR